MTIDSYHFAERAGPDHAAGGPLLFAFHGTGGDENQFLDLAQALLPEAIVIAPRGDVSENGALRFFRRRAEGVYDMDDLAMRTQAMAGFLRAHVERLKPSQVIGLGYSNGANILASVMMEAPGLFDHAALMHPLIPWTIQPGDALAGTRILVTAGGRDPICPPELTGQFIDSLEGLGAEVKSQWHPGGHEIAQSEIEAVAGWFADIRAGLVDPAGLPVRRVEEENGKGRYIVDGPGNVVAEMIYTLSGEHQLVIDHTEVPDAFRGTGTGMRLLEALIGDARREGRKIIPICPFAAAQFQRHPEWSDILAVKVKAGR